MTDRTPYRKLVTLGPEGLQPVPTRPEDLEVPLIGVDLPPSLLTALEAPVRASQLNRLFFSADTSVTINDLRALVQGINDLLQPDPGGMIKSTRADIEVPLCAGVKASYCRESAASLYNSDIIIQVGLTIKKASFDGLCELDRQLLDVIARPEEYADPLGPLRLEIMPETQLSIDHGVLNDFFVALPPGSPDDHAKATKFHAIYAGEPRGHRPAAVGLVSSEVVSIPHTCWTTWDKITPAAEGAVFDLSLSLKVLLDDESVHEKSLRITKHPAVEGSHDLVLQNTGQTPVYLGLMPRKPHSD